MHHEDTPNLQQLRWPPTNIADTAAEALSRLFMLPGASYRDPEFSWKHVVAPAGIGFGAGRGLGPQFDGDLLVGGTGEQHCSGDGRIHVGGPTVAGDVVVTLPPPTTGTATGCVSADRELLRAIVRNPSGYYVNVHNAAFRVARFAAS